VGTPERPDRADSDSRENRDQKQPESNLREPTEAPDSVLPEEIGVNRTGIRPAARAEPPSVPAGAELADGPSRGGEMGAESVGPLPPLPSISGVPSSGSQSEFPEAAATTSGHRQKVADASEDPVRGSSAGRPGSAARTPNSVVQAASDGGRRREAGRPREAQPASSYPQYSVAMDLVETFMAQDHRALFRARHPDDPPHAAPYRATVFWPVRLENGKERLYPFMRARFGGTVSECDSSLYFRRKSGEQYAGTAWFSLDRAIRDLNLPTLQDCGDDETWREAWHRGGVPRRITQAMATHEKAYLTRVRSLVCIGTETPYGPIVLCIESVRKDGFADEHLTDYAKRRYGDVGVMLTDIPRRVSDRSDFWTWIVNEVASFAFWITAATSIPVLGWLLKTLFDSVHLKAAWAYLPLAHPLALLLALGLMPHNHREGEDSPSERRITKFIERWRYAWTCLLFSQLGLSLRAFPKFSARLPEPMLQFLVPFTVTGAAYFIFGSYLCLTRFPKDPKKTQFTDVEQATAVPSSVYVFAIAMFLVSFCKVPLLWVCPASIALGVALCLLAGRFDSYLIGTPKRLVSLLYLGALLYPLSCMLASLHQFAASDPKLDDLAAMIQPALEFTYVISLPLTAVLFAVVCWSVRGRVLERYFANIERVGTAAPRGTLRDAIKARGLQLEKRRAAR
jgi:hypothetical protein